MCVKRNLQTSLVQPPVHSRTVTSTRSGQPWLGPAKPVSGFHSENGDPAPFWGAVPRVFLLQGKKRFLMSSLNLPDGDLGPLPLILSPVASKMSLAPSVPSIPSSAMVRGCCQPAPAPASPQPDPTSPAPSHPVVGWVLQALTHQAA